MGLFQWACPLDLPQVLSCEEMRRALVDWAIWSKSTSPLVMFWHWISEEFVALSQTGDCARRALVHRQAPGFKYRPN